MKQTLEAEGKSTPDLNLKAFTAALPFLAGGGEMGALMRGNDWSKSPLGDPKDWPQSLRAVVALMINSRYPMFVAWGPELAFLYNDGYIPIFGKKHPQALGLPFHKVWSEIWTEISPLIDRALAGEATFSEDLHLVMERNGYPEDTWYSFSYSPVRDESGAVAGMFCACTETTLAVLDKRRREALLKLDGRLRDLSSTSELSFAASEILGSVLGAARAGYGAIDADAGTVVVERNWYASDYGDLAGTHDFADYGSYIADLRQGNAVANADVATDPRTAANVHAFDALRIRAHLDVPVVENGKTVGLMFVHSAVPRVWTPDEISFVRDFAERTRASIARRLAEHDLRESEARQSFLLALSDELRLHRIPAEIASVAAKRLSERFDLSRVFHAEVVGTRMKVDRDYTSGVCSMVGEHNLDAFGAVLLGAYHEHAVVRVDDVRTDERLNEAAKSGLLSREVGAFLDVVLFKDKDRINILAMQDAEPRAWTTQEEGLFREVGERARAAIERARAEQRLRELNETLEQRVAQASADRDRMWRLSTDIMLVARYDGTINSVNPAWTSMLGWDEESLVGNNFLNLVHPEDRAATLAEMATLGAGKTTFLFENRYKGADGSYRHLSWTAVPADDLIHAVGRDVTKERDRQAELDAAQNALRHSQKMEAMGQLTGGVAHDFNNLLTPIVGSLDMLQRKGLGGEREQRLIAGAMQSAERAKTLVQRLLAFARRQPLQAVPVDVADLLSGMGDLVSSTTGPQIKVVVEAPMDLPAAMADPNQLEMALLNLAVNARDAMPEGGTLRISARAEAVVPEHEASLRPGDYICLSVADTGTGMDEATLARAIEPFFSTKGVGKGTGLGLSMVHGLASQLGGKLMLRSRQGLGTNVELWLPISRDRPGSTESEARSSEELRMRGTALLVDDEELVRISTADMLTDLGYSVVEADSGEKAMSLIASGLRIDLLVTDHLMSGMNGTDLARAVRRSRPDMPVLLVSGYAEQEGVDPDVPRLVKPFRKDELAGQVAQLTRAKLG